VDFDGTIVDSYDVKTPLSDTKLRRGAKEAVERLHDAGIRIIIWTARNDEADVKRFLNEHGIPWDEFNENTEFETGSRKVVADIYVDDRGVPSSEDDDWDDVCDEVLYRIFGRAKQPVSDYDELKELGKKAQDELARLLTGALGFSTVYLDKLPLGGLEAELAKTGGKIIAGAIKPYDRSEEKVESDYSGDWRKLLDVVRSTVACDSLKGVYDAIAKVRAAGGVYARAPKNRFKEPMRNGYRDYLANYLMPCGMIVEVQYHVKPVLIAREREAISKNILRSIEAAMDREGREEYTPAESEARHRALKDIKRLYARAWDEVPDRPDDNDSRWPEKSYQRADTGRNRRSQTNPKGISRPKNYLAKSQGGPCQPGERADLTGCVPLGDKPNTHTGGNEPSSNVQSAAFKNWFGDWESNPASSSKVVDERGKPLTVYHGTYAQFDEFRESQDLGYHFGTEGQANFRISGTPGGVMMTAYLNIKNPIKTPDHVWDTPQTTAAYFEKNRLNPEKVTEAVQNFEATKTQAAKTLAELDNASMPLAEYRKKKKELAGAVDTAKRAVNKVARETLEGLGYDGIVYENKTEGEGLSWVAFRPEQIKSTKNEGTFDPSSSNINKAPRNLLTKSQGAPCEPGETAASTGCIPLNRLGGGDSGSGVAVAPEPPTTPMTPAPAERGGTIAAEMARRAAAVQFHPESIADPESDVEGGISETDYDDIQREMTSEEQSVMEDQLAEAQQQWVDNAVESYDPSDNVDLKMIATDLNLGAVAIARNVKKIIEANVPEGPQRDDLLDKLKEWDDASNPYKDFGEDGIASVMRAVGGSGATEELNDALDTYATEAADDIQSAIQEAVDQEGEEYATRIADRYDDSDDRHELLTQFYRDNEDRFQGEGSSGWDDLEDNTWYNVQGEDEKTLKLTTSDGSKYFVSAFSRQMGGFNIEEVQFRDERGSFSVTGRAGGSAHEVFGKVVPAIVAFAQHNSPPGMYFSAAEESRQKLYDRLVKSVARVVPEYAGISIDTGAGQAKGYVLVKREHLEKVRQAIQDKYGARGIPIKIDNLVKNLTPEINPVWFVQKGWLPEKRQVRKGLRSRLTKSQGAPCQPGETEASTGCIPLKPGTSGRKPRSATSPAKPSGPRELAPAFIPYASVLETSQARPRQVFGLTFSQSYDPSNPVHAMGNKIRGMINIMLGTDGLNEAGVSAIGKVIDDYIDSKVKPKSDRWGETLDAADKGMQQLKKLRDAGFQAGSKEYDNLIEGLTKLISEEKKAYLDVGATRRDALQEALSGVRDMGRNTNKKIGHYAEGTDVEAAKHIELALDVFPTDWIKLMTEGKMFTVKFSPRGQYMWNAERIDLSRQYGQMGGGSRLCAIHELGHVMENRNRDIVAMEGQFLERRTQGEKAHGLYPGIGRDEEWGKEDKFPDKYCGRMYGAGPNINAYEVLTMGLEAVLGGEHGGFQQDKDYRHFILGMLASV